MRQYEIRWANLPLPIGRRPVLLLTRTSAYAYLNKVIVAEITSTIRQIPQEVQLGRKEGLAQLSVANMDNIHVIAKSLLGDRIGMVAPGREVEIKRALGYALDWPELKIRLRSPTTRLGLYSTPTTGSMQSKRFRNSTSGSGT